MGLAKKRILLCASACHPLGGSEPGVGWSAYRILREKHDVKVICSSSGREAIRQAATHGGCDMGDFEFIEETFRCCGFPAIDKLTTWLNFLIFQKRLAERGRHVIKNFRPDLIHQVTFASWRAGNPLAGGSAPFIWGPIGGGETLPAAFLAGFSLYSQLFEILRSSLGYFSRHSKSVRKTARTAGWIFVSNRETFEVVAALRGAPDRMGVLPVVFFTPEKMQKFGHPSLRRKVPGVPLQIFSGGYVEARKGVGLALQALARLKERGFVFQYENSGIGPEKPRLEAQIQSLGLTNCARFVPAYPGDSYDQKLRSTDIFLFPSLRDNCPATLLEAMGHGCVPVVADHAGPGEMVTPECGVKIPVTRPAEFVDRLTDELAKLFQDAERRRRLGEAARLRVIENFSQENWLNRVERAYDRVTH